MEPDNSISGKLRLLVVQPEGNLPASLFTEALDIILQRLQEFEVIVANTESSHLIETIQRVKPDALLIVARGNELPQSCSIPEILECYPGLPILWTGLGSPSIHIYTSRRLPARSDQLHQALAQLAGEHHAAIAGGHSQTND